MTKEKKIKEAAIQYEREKFRNDTGEFISIEKERQNGFIIGATSEASREYWQRDVKRYDEKKQFKKLLDGMHKQSIIFIPNIDPVKFLEWVWLNKYTDSNNADELLQLFTDQNGIKLNHLNNIRK